jgi:hypothetical protein
VKLTTEAVDAIAASHAGMSQKRLLSDAPYISNTPRLDRHGKRLPTMEEWHRITMCADHAGVPPSGSTVTMLYTNWRGETAVRTVVIERHWYGNTDWHPEPQEMFTAYEQSTGKTRDFAVAGVKDWNAGE